MYEEHACKFYQAQTHCSCWIHLRWSRVLDFAGKSLRLFLSFSQFKLWSTFRMGPSLLKTLPPHLMNMMFREWCVLMKIPSQYMFIVVRRENGNRCVLIFIKSVWILEIYWLIGFLFLICVFSVFWGEK